MKRVGILFVALIVTTGLAQAAPVTEREAVELSKKLCAQQIPDAAQVQWLVHPRGPFWEVVGMFVSKDLPRGVSVLVPLEGVAPKTCGRYSVRIAT